ncbi:hypothetical protein F7725_003910 [Dissostichus mawsoni]|uniref:Uncharacterized protein n=1 Tax=Dissostichus mawsoni TaxID=36200 RepID=A0A7J5YBJ0_DISMA|nr:hypothetical protein F7725_003910 [Dissostichus mawsoni]
MFFILFFLTVEGTEVPLQASERERHLEGLVFMLLKHTSHTDLRSPVSECPLCGKELVFRLIFTRRSLFLHLDLPPPETPCPLASEP